MALRRGTDEEEPQRRAVPERTPLQQKILDALPEQVDIPEPAASYRLAGWLVALFTALLPLFYAVFVCLVGHGIYWHYQHNGHWARSGFWGFVFYLLVYVVGAMTIVFLIKPLVRWNRDDSRPKSIKRSVEPFLYDYVEALCRSLGAPAPRTIQIDLSPNAAVGYRFGLWSVFTGDLTLILGLPLVLGLSVRQLTGILAHEFGHLSQGFGMRMNYASGMVNSWFIRAVFERDWFDEKLERASRGKLGPLFHVVRFFIWLTRQLLNGLLWVSHGIRCRMSREREFDADLFESTLVGSNTFARTFSLLGDLGLAHQMAFNDLQRFFDEGRLADNFPALIVSNVRHIKPEFRRAIRKIERERKANRFDTHPPHRERIARAREQDSDGLLRMPGEKPDYPATVLFANLGTLCRAATTDFYRDTLGSRFRKNLVHPVEKMIERREAEHAAGEALDRYFLVHVPVDRPLTLSCDAAKRSDDSRALFEELREARETMLKNLVEYRRLGPRYTQAVNSMYSSAEALSIIDCGLSIKAVDFGLLDRRPATAEDKNERARAAVRHLAQRMLAFEEAASNRLGAALRLLQTPKVMERIPKGEALAEEMRDLIPQAVFISTMVGGLPSLVVLHRRISVLFSRFIEDTRRVALLQAIIERLEGLHMRLRSIRDELDGKPYPFDHADGSMDLRRFVIPQLPEDDNLSGLMIVTEQTYERLYTLQVRMYAKLAHVAEQVETALGLPPLEDPEEKKKPRKPGESQAVSMKKSAS